MIEKIGEILPTFYPTVKEEQGCEFIERIPVKTEFKVGIEDVNGHYLFQV